MIYLDYAAATPLDSAVLAAMQPYFSEQFYNPSALYAPARAVQSALHEARGSIAQTLGARPSEIIFTAGGTESDNLAIHGVMQRYPQGNVVTSAVEHDAVLAAVTPYAHHTVSVDGQGQVVLADLEKAITDTTVLVSIMYANNEVGTIQPLSKIGQLVQQVRDQRRQSGNELPLYFHTDACQAAGLLDLHVARLGVDLLTLNGGKIYGPKQSGILYVKGGIVLEPLIRGGGQERGLRSGTENPAACIGISLALQRAQDQRRSESQRLQQLQADCFKLIEHSLPTAIIQGSRRHRLPNNVHITIPGTDNERLLIELEQRGVLAAAGSACSASSETPSHVLRAMGISDEDARASLRFSMGRDTTAEQLAQTVDILRQLVA